MNGVKNVFKECFSKKNLEYLKRKIKCECGKEVAYVNLAKHKLSKSHNNLDNNITQEEKEAKALKTFEINKQKNLEYLKHKVMCNCGTEVAYVNLKRHKSSKLHSKKAESGITQKIEMD